VGLERDLSFLLTNVFKEMAIFHVLNENIFAFLIALNQRIQRRCRFEDIRRAEKEESG